MRLIGLIGVLLVFGYGMFACLPVRERFGSGERVTVMTYDIGDIWKRWDGV